jgi:UDP-N-acetylmuramoyl-tripeptide--D-alanyl-D-alanine ligase
VRVGLPGAHLMSNVLAAAAAGFADGIAFDDVCDAIERLDVPTRVRVVRLRDGITLLDDSYNAQPASLTAALALIASMPGRRLALLGDMLELGAVSDEAHEQAGREAARTLDVLFTCGERGRTVARAARAAGLDAVAHIEGRERIEAALREALRPGDVLLVKGSHALALDEVAGWLEREYAVIGGGER